MVRGAWLVAAASLTATLVMALLRVPLVRILFERGEFGAESTAAVAVVCGMALWYTVHAESGPFSAPSLHDALLLLLLFVATLVFTGLVLSAVLAQLAVDPVSVDQTQGAPRDAAGDLGGQQMAQLRRGVLALAEHQTEEGVVRAGQGASAGPVPRLRPR